MIRRLLLMLGIVLLITTAICAATTLGTATVKLDGRQVRAHETNLGDFVADALRHLPARILPSCRHPPSVRTPG